MAVGLGAPVIAEGMPVVFRDQTIWRDPTTFDESYLINIDFDETCFTTFISSGNGIEVSRAYEIALETVLGASARQDFSKHKGLSNRAPLDVIEDLIEKSPEFIDHALDHARKFFLHPDDITDIGLGMVARFAGRGSNAYDELTSRAITEMLVIRKKEQLMPQICTDWPLPVFEFNEVWRELYARKNGVRVGENWLSLGAHGRARDADQKWKRVHFAIVSSGHTDFIKKVMNCAGLPHPDIYMTDDEMRRQVRPRTKPDPYALELVRRAWLNAYVVPAEQREDIDFIEAVKRRQLYIGDDSEKDGSMAENDGTAFMLHDKGAGTWTKIGSRIVHAVEGGLGFEPQ